MTTKKSNSNSGISDITLAIACGGTGGHFFPGLSIAKRIQNQGGKAILFLGGPHVQEQLNIATQEKINAVAVPTAKLPKGKHMIPVFLIKFMYYIVVHIKLINKMDVNVCLGMGSFASAPLGLAAKLKRVPLFLHEGNSILGQSNRILSKWARMLLLSFPLKFNPNTKITHKIVGMPIRDRIIGTTKLSLADVKKGINAAKIKEFDPELPTLLVFGGSQGAKFINDLIFDAIDQLDSSLLQFQIIHLTGQDDNSKVKELYRSKNLNFLVEKNDDQIEYLLFLANFIVCRAGASTIFELAAFGKPALYIPLPTAKDNHQYENAKVMVEHNAGYVLEQEKCETEHFIGLLNQWLGNRSKFDKMGLNALNVAKLNATQDIIDSILENRN